MMLDSLLVLVVIEKRQEYRVRCVYRNGECTEVFRIKLLLTSTHPHFPHISEKRNGGRARVSGSRRTCLNYYPAFSMLLVRALKAG